MFVDGEINLVTFAVASMPKGQGLQLLAAGQLWVVEVSILQHIMMSLETYIGDVMWCVSSTPLRNSRSALRIRTY
jgi:hypothetical protein